jgi:hypothetical protein
MLSPSSFRSHHYRMCWTWHRQRNLYQTTLLTPTRLRVLGGNGSTMKVWKSKSARILWDCLCNALPAHHALSSIAGSGVVGAEAVAMPPSIRTTLAPSQRCAFRIVLSSFSHQRTPGNHMHVQLPPLATTLNDVSSLLPTARSQPEYTSTAQSPVSMPPGPLPSTIPHPTSPSSCPNMSLHHCKSEFSPTFP